MTNQQKFLLLVVIVAVGAIGTMIITKTAEDNKVESTEITAPSENIKNKIVATSTVVNEIPTSTTVSTPQTLTSDITYVAPGESKEVIHVSVNLDGNKVIQSISFSYDPTRNNESEKYLEKFQTAFNKNKASYIGKKISDISVSRLGGASLTSNAFNEAIRKISS